MIKGEAPLSFSKGRRIEFKSERELARNSLGLTLLKHDLLAHPPLGSSDMRPSISYHCVFPEI